MAEKKKVILYALSTCIWCRKTKNLLKELNVEFDCYDVDLLEQEEKELVKQDIAKWNKEGGYPTMVIDDTICIVGFDENKIKENLP